MIRVDEIYKHIWPYVHAQIPNTRLLYLDPPGHIDVENLFSFIHNPRDHNYILFFDQEPLDLQRNKELFAQAVSSVHNFLPGVSHAALVTSEFNSNTVQRCCQFYNWHSAQYFFNGWAALDWFRGYNRSWLLSAPSSRKITTTFLMPNRIVTGERIWRLRLLNYLFDRGIGSNYISCPDICPGTNITIQSALTELDCNWQTFPVERLPLVLDHSGQVPSWASANLDLVTFAEQSLLYLVTETVATGKRHHLTEKVFKPICLRMPFVLASTQGSLAFLRSYGFQTFDAFWDESYDDIPDDNTRLSAIADLVATLDVMSIDQKQKLFDATRPVLEHNYQHFYSGAFEHILWQELTNMLENIRVTFSL